jgi:cyclopropane fatty-acyl-phospholipid synthase-like methyltransferase
MSSINTNKTSGCESTSKVEKLNDKTHWETVYTKYDHTELGWFEENPKPSLDLIELCELSSDAMILNVGAGATTLVDKLIDLNYSNILATDISENALSVLNSRVSSNQNVKTIADDLTNPTVLKDLELVDLWHDRAVLHFFINEKDQDTYFDLLKSKVKSKGYVVLAMFNFDGATKCSGLPIKQYDAKLLSDKLGSDFELQTKFNHTYIMPSGNSREYVYTLFKKIS